MVIELTNENVKNFEVEFINILKVNNINVQEISEKQWKIEDREILIFKGNEFFSYINEEKPKTSISPMFTIINEERKEITVLHSRHQETSGSTDQKLPYGDFIAKDYVRLYDYISNYDLKVAYVLNDWFDAPKYDELMKYLKANSVCAWINKVKI